MKHLCPVCGLIGLSRPAYDGSGWASFDICTCCGCQFGYHDAMDPGDRHPMLRDKWIAGGMKWHSKATGVPFDWDPVEQLVRAGFGYALARYSPETTTLTRGVNCPTCDEVVVGVVTFEDALVEVTSSSYVTDADCPEHGHFVTRDRHEPPQYRSEAGRQLWSFLRQRRWGKIVPEDLFGHVERTDLRNWLRGRQEFPDEKLSEWLERLSHGVAESVSSRKPSES